MKLLKLPTWQQRIRMRLLGLGRRLQRRRRSYSRDPRARQDPDLLKQFRQVHNSPPDLSIQGLRRIWQTLCLRLKRPIPIPDSGVVPVLYVRDETLRMAGIRWLFGRFPRHPRSIIEEHGPRPSDRSAPSHLLWRCIAGLEDSAMTRCATSSTSLIVRPSRGPARNAQARPQMKRKSVAQPAGRDITSLTHLRLRWRFVS